jgi:hypothetical protein
MYKFIMPCYRFRCTCARDIHEINLLYKDYKEVLPCPCGESKMTRIFDNFNNKEGRTNNQKKHGSTEKRVEGGTWMKEETKKRKKDAPPDSREAISNEFWLGNEFKKGDKKLSDF